MGNIGAFVAWSVSVLAVSSVGTVLLIRANNKAAPGSAIAKLMAKAGS